MLNAVILSAIIKIAVSLRAGSDLRKLKTSRQTNDANDEDYVLRILNEIILCFINHEKLGEYFIDNIYYILYT